MEITQLKCFGGDRHLQHGQHIAIALRQDSGPLIAIYDDRNGHWIDIQSREEIGYLDQITNERILAVTRLVSHTGRMFKS